MKNIIKKKEILIKIFFKQIKSLDFFFFVFFYQFNNNLLLNKITITIINNLDINICDAIYQNIL